MDSLGFQIKSRCWLYVARWDVILNTSLTLVFYSDKEQNEQFLMFFEYYYYSLTFEQTYSGCSLSRVVTLLLIKGEIGVTFVI